MGEEPVTVTKYHYDRRGRLVRSESRQSPEWTAEQRAWILALHEHHRQVCSGCGGWLPETTTTDAGLYKVHPPYRCGQCTAISNAAEEHAKDHKHGHALRWKTTRRSPRP